MSDCCCSGERDENDTKDERPGPNPPDERSCTDMLCCLLIVVYWIGMAAIFAFACTWGDPDAVVYGSDHGHHRCGVGGMAHKPKVYYPRLSTDLSLQADMIAEPWRLNLYGICVDTCPSEHARVLDPGCEDPAEYPDTSDKVCGQGGFWTVSLGTVDVGNRCIPATQKSANATTLCSYPNCEEAGRQCYTTFFPEKKFWKMDLKSPRDVGDCLTQVDLAMQLEYKASGAGPAEEKIAQGMQGFNQLVMSVRQSRVSILLFGVVAPAILAFALMILMRWIAAPAVYIAIFLLLLVLLAATFLCAIQARLFGDYLADILDKVPNNTVAEALEAAHHSIEDSGYLDTSAYLGADTTNEEMYKIATLVLVVVDVVYVILVCIFSDRIAVAVEIVEEGSRIIGMQPINLLYPFTTMAAIVVITVYLVMGGLYIGTLDQRALNAALGNMTVNVSNIEAIDSSLIDYDDGSYSVDADTFNLVKKFLGVYHLLGYLWTANLFLAITTTTIAGAVSYWIFFRNDAEEYPSIPLLRAQYNVVRYHLGTMAFGSLILAIVQLLRAILEYINQQTQEMQEQSGILKFAMCCVRCCMWCFERFIKFVTSYAYIYTAINGDSFCVACYATFQLFFKYPSQVMVNAFVQQMLRIIQCTAVPLACSIGCYYYTEHMDENMNPILPASLALVFSYIICRVFSVVYETTIDTVFVCCMRDMDKYDGEHTPDDLKKAFRFEESSD